jgi:3-oxoacyl-[acyl-carrier protein] reductase
VTTRTAIVTGASAGIGLAVTATLASEGYAVTMVARHAERLTTAAEKLRGDGSEVTALAADVAADGAAAHIVATHLDRHGTLDVLVANAGGGTNGSVARTMPNDLDGMLRVNVVALFDLAREAVPALRREQPRAGSGWFVVISSLAGTWPTPGFAAYSATKGVGLSVARSIAAEEARHGVRACAICPAFVDTDLTAWTRDRVPPEEMVDPQDVAEAVRMLVRLSPTAVVTELVLRRVGVGANEP